MINIGKIRVVALCTGLSRILGFARVSLISFLFGTTGDADVLNLVFQIPNNLRRLLAEGSLSSAFIPVLSETLPDITKNNTNAQSFIQSVLGFQLLVLVPVLCISTVFSVSITQTIFSFRYVDQIMRANIMFKILIWYILPISVAAVCMAILNTHNHFTIPALSPLVSSIAVISVTLALHSRIGIYSVGWGILVGGIMQLLIHFPQLRLLGYRMIIRVDMKNVYFRRMLKKWSIIMCSAFLLFINQQITVYFASGLAIGSGSALIYALTFWQLPFGILGVSIITVLYPKMSIQYAHSDLAGLHYTLHKGMRYLTYMLLPATVFFLICSDDLIHLALQRGKFVFEDTIRTARVLRAYSVGLLGVALFQYLQRFYYAIHKITFTIKVLTVIVVMDIILSLWLKSTFLRVSGLGWANSISFWIGSLFYCVSLPRIAKISLKHSSKYAYSIKVISSLLIASTMLLVYRYLFPLTAHTIPSILRLMCLILFSCLYGVIVILLYRRFDIIPQDFFIRKNDNQ